jgi:hypothetical protein
MLSPDAGSATRGFFVADSANQIESFVEKKFELKPSSGAKASAFGAQGTRQTRCR